MNRYKLKSFPSLADTNSFVNCKRSRLIGTSSIMLKGEGRVDGREKWVRPNPIPLHSAIPTQGESRRTSLSSLSNDVKTSGSMQIVCLISILRVAFIRWSEHDDQPFLFKAFLWELDILGFITFRSEYMNVNSTSSLCWQCFWKCSSSLTIHNRRNRLCGSALSSQSIEIVFLYCRRALNRKTWNLMSVCRNCS